MALLLTTGLLTPASVAAATAARAVTTAPAGDGPPGFWWGTDSLPVTVPGSAPYQMPYLGGAYGGYIGMTGPGRTGWAAPARNASLPSRRPTTPRRTPTT